MSKINEIVLYPEEYKPKDEIVSFAKKIGYENIKDLKCRMDKRFIDFIKEYIKNHTKYEENNSIKKINFNNLAYIKNVNTEKKWCIMYDIKRETDLTLYFEKIVYLNIYQQENNYTHIELY